MSLMDKQKLVEPPLIWLGIWRGLGAEAFLYSKVGADELGRRALQEIARLGVDKLCENRRPLSNRDGARPAGPSGDSELFVPRGG